MDGPRVILVRRLLVLLPFTKLSFSLLRFYLDPLFLLGCILHNLPLNVLAISKLPLAVRVRLIRRWAVWRL